MEITVTQRASTHIITLAGRWDAFSTQLFEDVTSNLVQNHMMRLVVLDLAQVDYVSSFGMRDLLNLGKQLEPLHGGVFLASLRQSVLKVFTGSGFISLFPAYDSVDSAIAALKNFTRP